MKSKLFTPTPKDHGDCFVNPVTRMTLNEGFADTTDGGAVYPLKLGGSGVAIQDRNPAGAPVTTSCRPESDPSY